MNSRIFFYTTVEFCCRNEIVFLCFMSDTFIQNAFQYDEKIIFKPNTMLLFY